MIYLIDDKTQRQKEAGWDDISLNRLSSILKPIHLYSEIENEEIKKNIFTKGNVVLFHESFFDNVLNKHDKKGIEIRNDLINFAKNKELILVIFSGSKNIRLIDGNIAHMPVSVLYQNLELFCKKSIETDINLRYLLFGINHNLEEQLLLKLKSANISFRTEDIQHSGSNFIALTQSEEIDLPYESIDNEMLYTDEISDECLNDVDLYISQLINNWFQFKEYDNIFIPISFGQTLSDFNGLRFAMHIRCSENLNRLKNIYIYSYVSHNEIINNSFYDILKTKNIFLIDYKFVDFNNAINTKLEVFKFEELSSEINKIKLEAPKNYEDNHSISNEWAISRWAKALNSNDDEINNISNKIKSDIFFKYLSTIYPKNEIDIIPLNKLKLSCIEKPNILYIDDEAKKGWYENFCKIFEDENKLDFDYIDDELNSSSQDEIVELSMDNIVNKKIDIVILDFRLHQDDFKKNDIKEITGYKILKRIKEHNPGIQVIIFSATNKALNLLALQELGADGFIIKESPENSKDSNFTNSTIINLIQTINNSIDRFYLKEIYNSINEIKLIFNSNPLIKYYPNNLECLRGLQYQNLILNEIDSIFNILTANNDNKYNHTILMQFKIIECLIEIFIPTKNKENHWLFWDRSVVQYYYLIDGSIYSPKSKLNFYNKKERKVIMSSIPSYEYNSTRNKIDCLIEQKLNLDDKVDIHNKIKSLINYRNSYIHPIDRLSLSPITKNEIREWMNIILKIIKAI
jgi:CheY-like chemotaxis protein